MKTRLQYYITLYILVLFTVSCDSEIERENVLITGVPINITSSSATVSGLVIDLIAPLEEHGHCWSTSPTPSLETNEGKTELGPLSEREEFVSLVSPLISEQTYFLRAYAVQNGQVFYGAVNEFRTIPFAEDPAKAVITGGAFNITANSASVRGSINLSANLVSSFGHCWSTEEIPNIDDNITSFTDAQQLSTFTSELSALLPKTQYQIRAYFINTDGNIIYGTISSFQTASQ